MAVPSDRALWPSAVNEGRILGFVPHPFSKHRQEWTKSQEIPVLIRAWALEVMFSAVVAVWRFEVRLHRKVLLSFWLADTQLCIFHTRKNCGNLGCPDPHAKAGQNPLHRSFQFRSSAFGGTERAWTSHAHRESDRDASHEVSGLEVLAAVLVLLFDWLAGAKSSCNLMLEYIRIVGVFFQFDHASSCFIPFRSASPCWTFASRMASLSKHTVPCFLESWLTFFDHSKWNMVRWG